jgi:hypothetical protein
VVAVMALTSAFLFPAARAKDKPEDFTRIYQNTYDEVFQATEQTIERKGYSVIEKDKDKGTISSTTTNSHINLYVHVEVLNNTPETRVTIIPTYKGFKISSGAQREFAENFLTELQKVLSTYR